MRSLLLGIALACAAATGCKKEAGSGSGQVEESFPTMTLDEVEQGIAAKSVTPVDCNGDRTRKKLGVVPGAILVDDEEAYGASVLPADKATKLVFYCTDPG